MRKISILILLASVIILSCGNGKYQPTIVSLKDAGDNNITATGDQTVMEPDYDSFVVTFSIPMNDSSVTNLGNITLTCSNLGVAIRTFVLDSAAHRYQIAPEAPELMESGTCSMRFTSNIFSQEGGVMANTTYTFKIQVLPR